MKKQSIIATKTKSASRNAMLFLLLSARFGERRAARRRERSSPRTGTNSTTCLISCSTRDMKMFSGELCTQLVLKQGLFYVTLFSPILDKVRTSQYFLKASSRYVYLVVVIRILNFCRQMKEN